MKESQQIREAGTASLRSALEGVLKLAAEWDKQAKRLDNRADKTDGDQAANLYYRAQAHQDNAEAVRETIGTALANRAESAAEHDGSCCMNGIPPGKGPHPDCPGA